jgi:hypothetical protein
MEGIRSMKTRIATGFDFESLDDGTVLIEFYDDDGETLNTQVVSADVMASEPFVTHLTRLAFTQELDAIKAMLGGIGGHQKVPDGR